MAGPMLSRIPTACTVSDTVHRTQRATLSSCGSPTIPNRRAFARSSAGNPVCVRACVRACTCACVRVCVPICMSCDAVWYSTVRGCSAVGVMRRYSAAVQCGGSERRSSWFHRALSSTVHRALDRMSKPNILCRQDVVLHGAVASNSAVVVPEDCASIKCTAGTTATVRLQVFSSNV